MIAVRVRVLRNDRSTYTLYVSDLPNVTISTRTVALGSDYEYSYCSDLSRRYSTVSPAVRTAPHASRDRVIRKRTERKSTSRISDYCNPGDNTQARKKARKPEKLRDHTVAEKTSPASAQHPGKQYEYRTSTEILHRNLVFFAVQVLTCPADGASNQLYSAAGAL